MEVLLNINVILILILTFITSFIIIIASDTENRLVRAKRKENWLDRE